MTSLIVVDNTWVRSTACAEHAQNGSLADSGSLSSQSKVRHLALSAHAVMYLSGRLTSPRD